MQGVRGTPYLSLDWRVPRETRYQCDGTDCASGDAGGQTLQTAGTETETTEISMVSPELKSVILRGIQRISQ